MEDDLGAVDREGGNDSGTAPRERTGEHGRELRLGTLGFVGAVAVRRLREQHVGARERLRRQQQWMAGAAEVAAGGEGVAVLEGQVGPGGAEDVPTAMQHEPGAGHDLGLAADLDGVEELDGGVDVGLVVERFGGPVLGPAVFVGVLGRFHLEARAVPEHDLGEPGGVGGGQDRSWEAVPDQSGQIAAVVQVGMGDDHGVDGRGVARQLRPVAAAQVRETLEEAAVEEDPGMVALDEELAAGDGPDAAEEAQQRGSRPGRGQVRFCLGHRRPLLRWVAASSPSHPPQPGRQGPERSWSGPTGPCGAGPCRVNLGENLGDTGRGAAS